MIFHDRYGLPLSTTSEGAADAYREGLDLLLASWPGAGEAFERANELDPDFALPRIARARLHMIYAESVPAREKAALARTLVQRRGTDRERSHVEVIALGIDGQPARSLDGALAHLENWPRDALILLLPLGAFGLYAFSGMSDHDQARVDLCERHARHYGADWWFLTYLGWSHTENGAVGAGRQLTQHAIELRRENANAAHALAHAMYEDGSVADAQTLIDEWLPGYGRTGLLHGHIAWHRALLALEQDDADRALAIYTRWIAPEVTAAAPLNAVTDGPALLWRIGLCGHQVPQDLWRQSCAHAQKLFPQAGVPFADLHVAAAAAGAGDAPALERRIAEIEKRLADGKLPPGPVLPAICRALRAFADADFAGCARTLEPMAGDVVRVGGSHAQRDLVEDTLLVALMKAGEPAKARALLDRRLHRRSSPRDARWLAQLAVGD